MHQQTAGVRLAELKQDKLGCLEQFVACAQRLAEAVREERIEDLQAILDLKLQIITRVNQLDNRISQLLDREDAGDGAVLTVEERRQCEEIGRKVDELLVAARSINGENLDGMKGLRDQVAIRLKAVREGKKSLFLYQGKHTHAEGVFLDKKR